MVISLVTVAQFLAVPAGWTLFRVSWAASSLRPKPSGVWIYKARPTTTASSRLPDSLARWTAGRDTRDAASVYCVPMNDGMHVSGVRLVRERVVRDHLRQIRPGKHDDGWPHAKSARDLGLQRVGQARRVGVGGGEQQVAALDVGSDLSVPERGGHIAQVRHRYLAAAADVDAAQQREISGHPPSLALLVSGQPGSRWMSGNVPFELAWTKAA